ncbi:hypothetical protein ACIQGT_26100 [Streptomyces sp. NPDC093108]|uniref:hypothetical protein n=1 Tax=Streptomyces sp. NPDC093108 TaxID=3366030 RepID=UPI003810E584
MNVSPEREAGQLDTSPINNDAFHATVHADFLSSHLDPGNLLLSGETDEVWCTAALPDEVWWHSAAIHESAHATLAWMLGLSIQRLALAQDRAQLHGGGAWVDGPADAQYYAVEMLGPAIAQADWLAHHGYTHPELGRCVKELSGSGDQAIVDEFTDRGFVVDRIQAVEDASVLLSHPRAQVSLRALAELLLEERDLEGSQIARVFHSHRLERRPHTQVWRPGRRLALIAAPPPQASLHRTEPPKPAVQTPQANPEAPLDRLLSLAKRVDAESRTRQRVAKTPQEHDRAHKVPTAAQASAEHLLNHGRHQGQQPG